MPRDYSKPPRGDRSQERGARKPGGFSKPGEKREPRRDDNPFGKFRKAAAQFGRGTHGHDAPRDFHPPRYDDELFAASGKVADIVGPGAQSRHDMLRKLWDFFRAEELIVPAGRPSRARADDWRHDREERPRFDRDSRPPKRPLRKPAGEHPTARKKREIEAVPHRKYKETRER